MEGDGTIGKFRFNIPYDIPDGIYTIRIYDLTATKYDADIDRQMIVDSSEFVTVFGSLTVGKTGTVDNAMSQDTEKVFAENNYIWKNLLEIHFMQICISGGLDTELKAA